MVKLNKIYTRTGDKGTTGLGSGECVAKSSLRIEAYGTVDETNSCVGMARLHTKAEAQFDLDAMLLRIQNDLFDLGADLATPDRGETLEYIPLRIIESQVERLEQEIDAMNADLAPLTSFVLPGGEPAAAALHHCRTVARRAERIIVALSQIEGEIVGGPAIQYINRLSDFFFVASRFVNHAGGGDVLWVPGQNR
ncbi:MAG: cob(I)yrinic acid a,c-diamide adenosyltransferase [Fimbriimonadaceae bacterium]|nr:cob(I)yrinic acid a,c-diamide adenosyltransferase [Alphaproteobacteria bacterium]